MIICPSCKAEINLPLCSSCGYAVPCENGIWQLSNMPDIVIQGDGDKYIGYDFIGESYSGSRKYTIEEGDRLFAQEVSQETGAGVFLDLACGDGCFTVPCASFGTKIIAGDISNVMLSILQKKQNIITFHLVMLPFAVWTHSKYHSRIIALILL